MAADIAGLAEVAHAAGVPLVVDQAWGPHFGFNEALPPTALSQGADAMLTSTHKIAGSLTQSAMLHISAGDRIDAGAVARALRLLRSTSPSSLLTASLDGARRQLALHGEQLLFETLEAIEVARAKLETIPGIALVDASLVGRMGVAGYDPLRIVLDVRGTGRTGYEIADALRRSYDVHVELPMQATVVFVVGLGETAGALRRLAGDVDEVVKRMSEPGATAAIVPPAASLRNEVVLSPREAFLGEAEQVAVDDAVGRISCESIASYPPGVPALLPGERISAETVTYLRELAGSGARLHGASDPAFETINVLREAG
jgi:arginine/lysine/ornithine decarboxylase